MTSVPIGLGQFLQEHGLTELGPKLIEKLSLQEMHGLLMANRPILLERLKEIGIDRLGDRQKLANSLSRASKQGALPPAPPMPHLEPCTFEETAEQLTVWLSVPAGIKAHQMGVDIDANSVQVHVLGERTALRGRLCGHICPAKCTWELQRSPAVEYDPLLEAAEQPAAAADRVVLTLVKATHERWVKLLSNGVARRREEDNPVRWSHSTPPPWVPCVSAHTEIPPPMAARVVDPSTLRAIREPDCPRDGSNAGLHSPKSHLSSTSRLTPHTRFDATGTRGAPQAGAAARRRGAKARPDGLEPAQSVAAP